MGISFAGVPLLLDDPDGAAQAFIDKFLPQDDWSLIGGRPSAPLRNPGKLPIPNYTWPQSVKLNTLYLPSGASRWGFFVGLVGTKQRDDILAACSPDDHRFSGTLTLTDDRDYGQDFSRTFYLLPMRPVSTPSTVRDGLWLLPLVDARWYWQFDHVGRIRCGWYATWVSLLDQLVAHPLIGERFTYATPDADWFYPDRAHLEPPFQNLGLYLDAVCNSIGTRFAGDANDAWKAMTWATSETNLKSNLTSLEKTPIDDMAGGSFEALRANIPGISGETWTGGQLGGSIPKYLDLICPEMSGQEIAIRKEAKDYVQASDATGINPGLAYITNVAKAIRLRLMFNNNADDSLLTTRLAAKVADAYYRSVRHQYDNIYAGLKPWTMTGFDDWLIYSLGSHGCDGPEFWTRTISHKPSFDMGTQLQNLPEVCLEDFMVATAVGGEAILTLRADNPTTQYLIYTGNVTLKYGDDETSVLSNASSAADVQAALEALPSIGAGNVTVTGNGVGHVPDYFTITFTNDLAAYDNPRLQIGISTDTASITCSTSDTGQNVMASAKNSLTLFGGGQWHIHKVGQRYEAFL